MNVLPLVLLLILVLSAFSMRQLESFKNSELIKKEYLDFIHYQEGKDLDFKQRKLYNSEYVCKTRRLNFRPFFDKKIRAKVPEENFAQLSQVLKELIKVLYSEAAFFKKIKEKRPQFIDEMIDQIVKQAEEDGKAFDGRIENMAKIKFSDSDLQEAFYHMLKGTIDSQEEIDIEEYKSLGSSYKEKSYKSLLDFLRDQAMPNCESKPETIIVYSAPFELILAIYEREAAFQIIHKIEELEKSDLKDDQKKQQFESFVKEQAKNPGIKNDILNFSISTTKMDDSQE